MRGNKTGLVVIAFLAAMFFLFAASIFGSTVKRNASIAVKESVEADVQALAANDVTIYWIGETMTEFEGISSKISYISPAMVSRENMPIRGSSFHRTVYSPEGELISEDMPTDYSDMMVIIINGSPELTENGKAALLDAVTKNGVPVIAIGDEASELVSGLMYHRRLHTGPNTSLYYCLGVGFEEDPLSEEAVGAGGLKLADELTEVISKAMKDYVPMY